MPEAVIVDAVRSPMGRGKPGGALSAVHPVDLLAAVLTGARRAHRHRPGHRRRRHGRLRRPGRRALGHPGRQAWLAAGYPGARAVGDDRAQVRLRPAGAATSPSRASWPARTTSSIAAGVESMSRVPMGSARMGADPHGPGVRAPLPRPGAAGRLRRARRRQVGLSRAAARRVRRRARTSGPPATAAAGGFDDEIVPVTTPRAPSSTVDESIRPGTTVEKLGRPQGRLRHRGDARALPAIDWKVTAGNSSQITDGAGALLRHERGARRGARPAPAAPASIAVAVVGDDPMLMLTGPIPATAKVLRARRDDHRPDRRDRGQRGVRLRAAGLAGRVRRSTTAKLNPRGGAIALGHPLGASGARLMTTLLHHLEQTGGRYGLQTMCEAGGMANATIVERLG